MAKFLQSYEINWLPLSVNTQVQNVYENKNYQDHMWVYITAA